MARALLLMLALTFCACSKSVSPSVTESEGGELTTLDDGDQLLRQVGSENRDARLVVLHGRMGGSNLKPELSFEYVRTLDAPAYIDLDEQSGPEQWITVAEVQDDDGNVLWSDRINSLFQLLRYLEVIIKQQSAVPLSIFQLFLFLEPQYPQLLDFVVRVPTGIEGGTQYVLNVPGPDGTMEEALRLSIADVVADAQPPALRGEAKTLIDNGDPRDKVDIVILGDGYTAEQREKFELDAQAVAERFAQTEPFKTKLTDFNVHLVWTPSNESGAGYDCTGNILVDKDCKRDLRDTVFEMVFVVTALVDRLNLSVGDARVAMPLQVARLYEAASAVPFDEIIMLSNSSRTSGFAGLYVSVLTASDNRIRFPHTAVHELGHSFGVLGDEYNLDSDPCLNDEPTIPLPPNISPTAARDELKWAHLVASATDLPTSGGTGKSVGAYSGAYNCNNLYRPVHDCKMRSSEKDFCPVCAEQLVHRIFAYVDPIAHGAEASVRRDGDSLVFTVPPRDDTIGVHWFVDGVEVAAGPELRLKDGAVTAKSAHVEARASDDSGWVVKDRPQSQATVQWWVEY